MLLQSSSFHPVEPGIYKSEFTTQDGHRINVFINTGGTELDEDAVSYADEYLRREMEIRRQAAFQIFAKYEYIKTELEYATADDLLKALEPGALTVLWERQETRMAYLSPMDDLECPPEKYVILVSHDRATDELEINLEQATGW